MSAMSAISQGIAVTCWETPLVVERRNITRRRSENTVVHQAETLAAALDLLGEGVVLINDEARVVFASELAQSMIYEMRPHVAIEDSIFKLKDTHSAHKLKVVLDRIKEGIPRTWQGDVIVIYRDKASPWVLSTIQLASSYLMVIVRNPGIAKAQQWDAFATHFNLTACEVRLCKRMAEGMSINDFSYKYYVSKHTTRTHLKSIFLKTSTRRQSDLLRLMFAYTRL